MQTWIWILGCSLAVSLATNVALAALLRRRKRPTSARTLSAPPATPGPQQLISPLIRERDPLGNLVKFMYWQKQGKASSEDGYQVGQILLDELRSRWGLEQIGQFGERVIFDPQGQRAAAGRNLIKGETVRIVEPGWRMGSDVLKFPLVEK